MSSDRPIETEIQHSSREVVDLKKSWMGIRAVICEQQKGGVVDQDAKAGDVHATRQADNDGSTSGRRQDRKSVV